jgi:hypothetical protein
MRGFCVNLAQNPFCRHLLWRRLDRRNSFLGLLGFQKLSGFDDLLVILKLRQLGAVQILAELPELRINIVEVNDANRRLLATDDAQRFEPVPAGDKNMLAIANDACERRL